MRGVENNATRKYNGKRTTSNKKKISGAENIFLLFQFLLIFPVSKVVQFYIHFVFFLLLGDGRPFFSTLAWNFCLRFFVCIFFFVLMKLLKEFFLVNFF